MSKNIENLQKANAEYAKSFDKPDLPLPPKKHYIILCCMDSRLDPFTQFGPSLGDAHIIRNGGGSVRDALRSIVISQQFLETTEIMVIKHTDCGFTHFKEVQAHDEIRKNLGEEAGKEVVGWDFESFEGGKEEDVVRKDVEFLKGCKLVQGGTVVSGWVYDVRTGKCEHVV